VLTNDEMQMLMQLADGELDAEGESRAVRMLAQHPDAHDLVLETLTLGDWVRETAEAPAMGFDIADAVMARLDATEKPQHRPDRPTLPSPPSPRSDEAGKVLAFPRPAPLGWGIGVVAALAVAAGIAFLVQRPKANVPETAHVDPITAPAPEGSVGVAVDHVESPNGVSVFYLPAAINANASSVVVWIDDSAPAPAATATTAPTTTALPNGAPGEKK
jgi:negative regulator of sigma E activity